MENNGFTPPHNLHANELPCEHSVVQNHSLAGNRNRVFFFNTSEQTEKDKHFFPKAQMLPRSLLQFNSSLLSKKLELAGKAKTSHFCTVAMKTVTRSQA